MRVVPKSKLNTTIMVCHMINSEILNFKNSNRSGRFSILRFLVFTKSGKPANMYYIETFLSKICHSLLCPSDHEELRCIQWLRRFFVTICYVLWKNKSKCILGKWWQLIFKVIVISMLNITTSIFWQNMEKVDNYFCTFFRA